MIRTLVVDDQNIIRKGIKVLLENSAEIELVGFAENGKSAIEKVETTQPNVMLLDINLPDIDGLTIAKQIGAEHPEVKIIMLSSCEDESYVRKAVASNAKGYLLKNVSAEELEWAIKLVHQGYSAFKSELLESLSQSDRYTAQEMQTETQVARQLKVEEPKVSTSSTSNGKHFVAASAPLATRNSDEIELLLARDRVRQKYPLKVRNKRRHLAFHNVNISRAKKTMMSFEFKLLVLLILFGLGSLIFVALS